MSIATTEPAELASRAEVSADIPARYAKQLADHHEPAAAIEAADPHVLWTSQDGALPSLYISHSAPPFFEDIAWMTQLLPYAHPTVEHFTPIFVTLGAATDPESPVTTTIDGYFIGLAKRSFQTT